MLKKTFGLTSYHLIFASLIVVLGGSLIWILSTQPLAANKTISEIVTATPTPLLSPSATPHPTAVASPTTTFPSPTATLTPLPTVTNTATSTKTPPISNPYGGRIIRGSPSPPTQTPTPTPTRHVTFDVVSKRQVPLENIWSLVDSQAELFKTPTSLIAWTENDGIIFNAGYTNEHYLTWQVSPDTGKVQARSVWQKQAYPATVQVTIDQIKTFDPHAKRIFVSPDQQWVAWQSITSLGDLLLKKVGDDDPPYSLLLEDIPRQFTGSAAWSPSSNYLAYVIDWGNHQLHIQAMDGTSHIVYQLTDRAPTALSWSLDEQFIAFVGGEEDHQDTDIYIAHTNGRDVLNVTTDDLWPTKPIWHPHKYMLAYSVINAGQVGLWVIEFTPREE